MTVSPRRFTALAVAVLAGCAVPPLPDDPTAPERRAPGVVDSVVGEGEGEGEGEVVVEGEPWRGEERAGHATFYDADGTGACLFDASPDDLDVAALGLPSWEGGAWCGACAAVDGPSGSRVVRIVDQCPECPANHLDLSAEAFARIANPDFGIVDIAWRFVPCDVAGNVSYRVKEGANVWWLALQVRNHRLPIASLEIAEQGSDFVAAALQPYGYHLVEYPDGIALPARLRVTAIDGQVVVDELAAVVSGADSEGAAQF